MAEAAAIDYRHSHFEFPILSPVIGEPDYEQLLCILKELKANAQSVHSTLGGGAHGYLGLLLSPVQYVLVSNVPFVIPAFPAPLAIPLNATQHMTFTLQQQHRDAVRIFRECQSVQKALRQQLVQAVPKIYLDSLRDQITNSISRPIRGILQHLFDTYGNVTPQRIAEETEKLTSSIFDPIEPVDTLFMQIETLSVLADAGHSPFTPQQIVNFAYNAILKTRKFSSDIIKWNRLAAVNKTWIQFKVTFRQAQKELKETGDLRLDAQFQHANLVQDIVSGLSNALQRPGLDESSISDSIMDSFHLPSISSPQPPPTPVYDHYGSPVPALPPGSNVIPPLQANAVAHQSEMQGLLAQIAQMQTTINTLLSGQTQQPQYDNDWRNNHRGGRNGRGGRYSRGGRGPPRRDQYCFSHGACAHKGSECRSKAPGHKDAASFDNKQGGSTKNCPG